MNESVVVSIKPGLCPATTSCGSALVALRDPVAGDLAQDGGAVHSQGGGGTAHAPVFANRLKWFSEWGARQGHPSYVLWWVESGVRPTVLEAKRRFALLGQGGPSQEAFQFKTAFSPPTAM